MTSYYKICYISVADPGFPIGGVDLVRGRGLPRRLHFENFFVKMKESGPLEGGVRRAH